MNVHIDLSTASFLLACFLFGMFFTNEGKFKFLFLLCKTNNTNAQNDEPQTPPVSQEPAVPQKPKIKYEDKYADAIKQTSKEFEWSDEDKREIGFLFSKQVKTLTDLYEEKIHVLTQKITILDNKISLIVKMTEGEFIDFCQDDDQDVDQDYQLLLLNKQDFINNSQEKRDEMEKELLTWKNKVEDTETVHQEAMTAATNAMVEQKIEKLKGCFVMEHTPLGNVLMTYNAKRTSFSYYSDSTIPYRYLEVVGRKFVKMFHCRPLFVDMEEELKSIEKKWEERKKQELSNAGQAQAQAPSKNVFAKLKNYNKSTGKVNVAPPPKSSIPHFSAKTEMGEKHLLKENANRYTYEGKISTFSMLKKVERKVVDKKYAMTFADFKKLQKEK